MSGSTGEAMLTMDQSVTTLAAGPLTKKKFRCTEDGCPKVYVRNEKLKEHVAKKHKKSGDRPADREGQFFHCNIGGCA